MSRLDARLGKLERSPRRGGGSRVTVWMQDAAGADTFTSPQHPGVTLTAAELAELPTDDRPGAGISVIVVRYVVADRDA